MEEYKSKIIEEAFKDIPIENQLNAANEIAFIDLITELGYREDKMWTEEENHILEKLMSLARSHTQEILNIINYEKI